MTAGYSDDETLVWYVTMSFEDDTGEHLCALSPFLCVNSVSLWDWVSEMEWWGSGHACMLGRHVYWGLLAWTSVYGGNLMCGWPGLGFLCPSDSACLAETLLWDFLASSIQWFPPWAPTGCCWFVNVGGGRRGLALPVGLSGFLRLLPGS